MGEHSSSKRKKKYSDDTSSSSQSPSSSASSSDDESSLKRHKSSSRRHREERSSRREKEKRREKERRRKRRKEKRRERDRKRGSSSRRDGKRKVSDSDSESEDEAVAAASQSDGENSREDPVDVVRYILTEFPAVSNDLEQLLRMIDDGQAVDIRGLSERSLVKHLRRLFLSLNLKENGQLVFLLPSDVPPTLEVVGAIIRPKVEPEKQQLEDNASQGDNHPVFPNEEGRQVADDTNFPSAEDAAAGPKRRVIGPAMPSAELLAAAAKLTEAEAELREAEMDEDGDALFIGPPPPAVVKEAESANEAERFEEITRIMGAEVDNPYDVVGVNRHMAADNIKKRYWKLSLMVHPDKCAHPQAHQAFIKLNKSFKELQDPEKRKAMDEKIDLKEEQERFKVELKAMREAAQWRRLQGISLEGDDILLADLKEEKRRDEWMTTLPPEKKPGGMPTHTTSFSRTAKEGRGDTSAWTETPSERAQKAKMNYLEAYNQAAALASSDGGKKTTDADAELVDKYNKAKRSKSLVEKHQESTRSRTKKKSSGASKQEQAKEAWEGQHPWKPWDREKDLTGGRQNVKLDSDNMAQGLTSRFSSGSFQRNFL